MDISKVMKHSEDNKADYCAEEEQQLKQARKIPPNDFEELLREARGNPKVAAYLDMLLTKEQVIGYLIAAIQAEFSFLNPSDQAALIMAMERKFLTMLPEEAERIYAKSWYQVSKENKVLD